MYRLLFHYNTLWSQKLIESLFINYDVIVIVNKRDYMVEKMQYVVVRLMHSLHCIQTGSHLLKCIFVCGVFFKI